MLLLFVRVLLLRMRRSIITGSAHKSKAVVAVAKRPVASQIPAYQHLLLIVPLESRAASWEESEVSE